VLCGDGVGMVVKYMGMGWGWKKFHGDGAGMGLIFTTVSLFISNMLNDTFFLSAGEALQCQIELIIVADCYLVTLPFVK